MNKTALRKFATSARRELLERVELQARKIGITKDAIQKANVESSDAIFIDGRQLSAIERKQREKLIARIEEIGFDQVMEETAYTWFNRFIALHFMEVNDYLPTRVRVLSSSNPQSSEPDMIREALSLDLDIDREYVYELKINNKTDELFKYLILAHCNDLNRYLPFMFETIEDYTEILFPEGLLSPDSFLREMTDPEIIPEEDWQHVEIIGWLYQYYIAEEKDEIYANLKKNIKVTKDKLPSATQLFTPNWIVRYLVENSLGRIWLESYPNSSLKSNWKYYLDEAEQEQNVIKQLETIRYRDVNPENITLLDPCCGSGHVLVYAFDVFYDMYIEKGYIPSEIPKLILEKNLYGLDVDDRAVQLASFAVMMKAREKSRRVFSQNIKLNICAIQESNWLSDEIITTIARDNEEAFNDLQIIKETFRDAEEFGSLLNIEKLNFSSIEECLNEYKNKQTDLLDWKNKEIIMNRLPKLIKQSKILSQKYDILCTNPPYLGRKGMNEKLRKYLDKHHQLTKYDLFAAFIERSFELVKNYGFSSIVTMQSWMFLSSYEKFRKKLINNKTIYTLLHMDNMVMGIAFGTSATIFRNVKISNFKGKFTEIKYSDLQNNVPKKFPVKKNKKGTKALEDFNKIPGNPIAYWISDKLLNIFSNDNKISSFGEAKSGLQTGNNNLFLRQWFEVEFNNIAFNMTTKDKYLESGLKWVPQIKGGEFRRWFGNFDYIVNWENDGKAIRSGKGCRLNAYSTDEYYFKMGITWSHTTSGVFGSRYLPTGYFFNVEAPTLFLFDNDCIYFVLGFLNSNVAQIFLDVINQTMHYLVGNIMNLPLKLLDISSSTFKKINELVCENISISKNDWDSFEISWDFSKHPLLKFPSNKIKSSFEQWEQFAKNQFNQLKENEEELNRIFIDIYGLHDELTPDVADENVTVRKADLERDIKSFISYAVGCMFGRYSLDEEGLIFAGGDFDPNRYQTFPVDNDNIIPILSDSYFEDDMVTRFIEFAEVTYGKETLEENLDFIADAIGRRRNETARETIRRYFLNDFYKDHVQTYKKRPIYWMFSSGKEKAFNCLIYMHRYDKTTLSQIRTDYLHKVQSYYEMKMQDLKNIIESDASTKEIRDARRELKSLEKKVDELKVYDEKLHHMADEQIGIDLDHGVKVNYQKFAGLVAKI